LPLAKNASDVTPAASNTLLGSQFSKALVPGPSSATLNRT
jgi:hypothetical protein